MSITGFIFLVLAMLAGLYYSVKVTNKERKEIREDVLKHKNEYKDIIAVIKTRNGYQAENYLMSKGKTRRAARLAAVEIKKMIKSGELE